MKGKTATRLRRLAEANTIGKMDVSYQSIQVKKGIDGITTPKFKTMLASDCTRSEYQRLKKVTKKTT